MWETGYVDVAQKMAEHNMIDWRKTGTKRIICLDPHDYITIVEYYPQIDDNFDEFEIVLGVDLIAELIRDGKLQLTTPIERTVTYHDPCRLNKRLGTWQSPREILRAIPGLTFVDVDHVTQWSYCRRAARTSGSRPEITAEISRRRVEKAKALDGVTTLVSACPWSERRSRSRARRRGSRSTTSSSSWPKRPDAPAWSWRPGGQRRRSASSSRPTQIERRVLPGAFRRRITNSETGDMATLSDVIAELVDICGEEHVPRRHRRGSTARASRPVPGHIAGRATSRRWSPADERRADLGGRQAREPRANPGRPTGRGNRDGRGRSAGTESSWTSSSNQIHEIDLDDRTVTVGPGINMLKLSQELQPLGYIYPDDPASYPCSLVGGRIGTSGWSLIGGRYAQARATSSFRDRAPTGEIIRVGDGGKKIRKSSSGYQLKHFMGHQGTLGIVTEATLELVPRPESEFAAFFLPSYLDGWKATPGSSRGRASPPWRASSSSTSGSSTICAETTRPGSAPDWVKSIVAVAMYGQKDEVRAGAKQIMRIAKANGSIRGRRDLARRLGLAPRSLRDAAARAHT